jgi:hypothetical protein
MNYYNFSIDQEQGTATLEKPALVFIEGNHVDSSKREHVFSRERVEALVNNTNAFIRKGGRIPFQRDHKKDQFNNLGDIESEFYVKEITEQDLPIKKHTHLIGKMGVFVDRIVAKGQKVVEDIINQNIKTLSAGIDPALEAFVEVSATPIPAIIGPALFSKAGDADNSIIYFESFFSEDAKMGSDNVTRGKAYSFDQLKELNKNMDEVRKQYNLLSDGLFQILSDLKTSSEEELKDTNPIEASYDALEYFEEEVAKMFGLGSEDENEENVQSPETTPQKNKVATGRPYPEGKTASEFSRYGAKNLGFKLV